MIAATFAGTKPFILRVSVSPWLVISLLATACSGKSTPTTPSTTSKATSESWSSVVAPGGTSSRSFTVNASGTITVTLTSAGADTLGLGVGVPRLTGGGCRLGVAINASPGSSPQINAAADAGQYCVQVYDLGTLKDPAAFALKIDHP